MRISDWSSDVCSSDLALAGALPAPGFACAWTPPTPRPSAPAPSSLMTLRRPVSVVMPVPLWLVAGRAGTAGRGHTLAPCENVFLERCNKRRVAGAGGVDRAVGWVEPGAKPLDLQAGRWGLSPRAPQP